MFYSSQRTYLIDHWSFQVSWLGAGGHTQWGSGHQPVIYWRAHRMSSVKSIKNPGGHSKTMTKAGGLVLIRWKEGHLETLRIF